MITLSSGGPDWASIMTAFGTVGAVIVALLLAWRSGREARAERARAQEREQLAEANAVRVLMGQRGTGEPGDGAGEPARMAAIVINHGRYTITGLEAQLRMLIDSKPSLVPFHIPERVPGEQDLDPALLGGVHMRLEAMLNAKQLTPWDRGVRFESDAMSSTDLPGSFPVVRWTDRWGARWEHRRGEVRQIREGEDWVP